jgi:hypothetical protein
MLTSNTLFCGAKIGIFLIYSKEKEIYLCEKSLFLTISAFLINQIVKGVP